MGSWDYCIKIVGVPAREIGSQGVITFQAMIKLFTI